MSELRQRHTQVTRDDSDSSSQSSDDDSQHDQINDDEDDNNGKGRFSVSFLDVIRVLVTLVVASCGMSYYMTESLLWGYRPWFTRWPVVVRYINGPILLTPEKLSLYNGTDPNLPIYLAVNGSIFDVTANPRVYGPGGMYGFFAGKDAARAFVTGCFQEDLTSDLTGLEEMYIPVDDEDDEEEKKLTSGQKKVRREQEVRHAKTQVRKQVEHWQNFYRNHQKYFEVGRVVGGQQGGGKRKLCEPARRNRPKRREKKDQDDDDDDDEDE